MTNYPKRIGVKALCDNCKVYRITEPGMSVYNYVREDVWTEDIKQLDGILDHWKREAETARQECDLLRNGMNSTINKEVKKRLNETTSARVARAAKIATDAADQINELKSSYTYHVDEKNADDR